VMSIDDERINSQDNLRSSAMLLSKKSEISTILDSLSTQIYFNEAEFGFYLKVWDILNYWINAMQE